MSPPQGTKERKTQSRPPSNTHKVACSFCQKKPPHIFQWLTCCFRLSSCLGSKTSGKLQVALYRKCLAWRFLVLQNLSLTCGRPQYSHVGRSEFKHLSEALLESCCERSLNFQEFKGICLNTESLCLHAWDIKQRNSETIQSWGWSSVYTMQKSTFKFTDFMFVWSQVCEI